MGTRRRSPAGARTRALVALVPLFVFPCAALGQTGSGSISIGDSNEGSLVDGARIPAKGRGFVANKATTNPGAHYGTEELVQAIVDAAAFVASRAPGKALVVNDMSFAAGGEIPHHQSHRAGRDVDLLFYAQDASGGPVEARSARFDSKGRAVASGEQSPEPGQSQVLFDSYRNWLLVKALIVAKSSTLQRVFVSEGLRALMLQHAQDAREPAWVVERAGEVMCEPAVPHDDHFHVRLFCTAEDYALGCRDTWPLYPWRRTELAGMGILDPQLAPPQPFHGRRARPRRRSPGRTFCP